jgi:predicted MPP superfamily phosphohydrolase
LSWFGEPSALNTFLGWFSYIGFGFFSLVFAGIVFRDMISIIQSLSSRIRIKLDRFRGKTIVKKTAYDSERRRFLLNMTNIGILGTSALLTGYGFYEARRKAILEEVRIPIPNLPPEFNDYTIIQFSDIHAGPTIKRNFVQSVVEQINHISADAIVFTGDLVDGTVSNLRDDVAPLKDLYARDGVFFITGNHEYYSGVQPWLEEVNRLGMRILLNSHHLIKRGEKNLIMAGVSDITAENFIPSHKSDPAAALHGAGEDAVKILLAHQPKSIYAAEKAGFDLQISGHTHGGQYIPWSYLVTLSQPYIKGLHQHNNMWIYVNRGTGYWGPPLRLGIPSEVTKLILTRA